MASGPAPALRVLILGAAAGGGFPQWNSNAPGCRRARSGDPAAKPRTQSSIAVSCDGDRWVLFNASPDLRAQVEASPPLHPRHGVRSSPIAAVVVTNGDVDHVAGLLTLREGTPFALYGTAAVHATLAANPMFRVLQADVVPRRPLPVGDRVALEDAAGTPIGLEVRAFPVPGKVPLYRETETADLAIGAETDDVVGLEIRADATPERRLHYVPGCARVTPGLKARLAGSPLLLFDGSFWRDDEMAQAGAGTKTAARMGHIPMGGGDGSIAALAGLELGRRIFVHINNTNPVLLADTEERAAVVDAGWEVAEDGMEIVL
ncbi:MAG: pyrroloquinoline quinone biosynthesis protein PqqB [Alphaproteobacteria bacterium]